MAKEDFFIYPISFLALAPAATASTVLQIDASADFCWYYGAYSADVAAAGQTASSRVYPLVNILITPTDSNAQFMQSALPLTHLFGNGENPFVLPRMRVFAAQTAVTIQVTNRDAAQTYNLFLSLIGLKRFRV